jgi:general secretion pathway protein K
MAGAQKIVQARQARHFRGLTDVSDQLDATIQLSADDHAIASRYFEVRGRLRLGSATVDERSLVSRQGTTVTTLWRERGVF